MRLHISSSQLLLLITSRLTIAAPTPQPWPATHDERGFLDALGGAAGGINITSTAEAIGNDVASIVTDVTSLVQDFIAVVAQVQNVSTENDLVTMLGLAGGADGVTSAAATTTAAKAAATAATTTTTTTAAAETADALGVEAAVAAEVVDADNVTSTGTSPTTGTTAAAAGTTSCPGMAVLFARGTDEPGNVGLFAGPSFFTALRNYVNGSTSLAIQGVPYTASVSGFLAGGSPAGSALMASFISKTAAACPDTKLVVSGYSQGAQVVHNAMTMLNAAKTTDTATATTTATTATTATNPQAAMFVMQKSALGLASTDATNQGMGNVPAVKTPAGTNGAMQITSGLTDMMASGLGS